MDCIQINQLLNREEQEIKIKNILSEFETNKHNVLFKKGIYIYGSPGTGKTMFVTNILRELNYDIVKYDAGDIRNTSVIEDITKHNMSDKNIMSIFNRKIKKIAIIMDEIDGMNNGDKGGINSLIKLIRPKKTKKQRQEETTLNPIICIGNYHMDKKIKELMKVCNTVELKPPTSQQTINVLKSLFINADNNIINKISNYVQGDLRKMNTIFKLYKNKPQYFNTVIIDKIFQKKYYNDDTKIITQQLMNTYFPIEKHNILINETDRTSVGLLWHENIIDNIQGLNKEISIPFYLKQLENICFSDYIDRITFQKQIWQFNEMSSLIKTFQNNKLFHEMIQKNNIKMNKTKKNDVRFTKVLTKYSTEYNNTLFIQRMCQKLSMDKKDLFLYFISMRNDYTETYIINQMENYEIGKLEVNRIYRYIDKYTLADNDDIDETVLDDTIE